MDRKIVIRKERASLYTAAMSAVSFTVLAVLFVFFSKDTGGIRSLPFWLFLVIALFGWYMTAEGIRAYMIVSDEGITSYSITGKAKFVAMDQIQKIGTKKNFFFIYGKNNHVLTSMEADLFRYEDACALFKEHGIPIENRDPRKLIK